MKRVMIYIPELKEFVHILERYSKTLIVDKLVYYYEELIQYDGGTMLLDESVEDKYKDDKDLISDALKFLYSNDKFEYIVIEEREEIADKFETY